MAIRLWNKTLTGGQVPTVHPFAKVIKCYSAFRLLHPYSGISDQIAFCHWLMSQQNPPLLSATANAYWYPFNSDQLGIGSLNDSLVHSLAKDPQGRDARIFLYGWYRCNLVVDFPKCLADVYIVGYFRGKGMSEGDLENSIVACGYANEGRSVKNLISVGKGIGRHFGFLDEDDKPTAFFHSFFQETY